MTVVYEDDHLVAVWHPGSTDHLLVTFGDMVGLANGTRFFADGPVRKARISCLGYVAKAPNWYPAGSVARALDACRPLVESYTDRVIYGGSMGGYAAVKYSGLLRAREVIALCPQWSLDPAELGGTPSAYERYFVPHMAGMGVTPGDVSGRVFLFFDPRQGEDRFHHDRIASVCGYSESFRLPSAGHHVTAMFAGSRHLVDLIGACRSGTPADRTRVAKTLRRTSGVRTRAVLTRAASLHPVLAARAWPRRRADLLPLPDRVGSFHVPLLRALLRHGRRDLVERHLDALLGAGSAEDGPDLAAHIVERFPPSEPFVGAWLDPTRETTGTMSPLAP